MLRTRSPIIATALLIFATAFVPSPASTQDDSAASPPSAPCSAIRLGGSGGVELALLYDGAAAGEVMESALVPIETSVLATPGIATVHSEAHDEWGRVGLLRTRPPVVRGG
jgi:hypothetical protein